MRHRTARSLVASLAAFLLPACAPGEEGTPGGASEEAAAPAPAPLEQPIIVSEAGLAGPESALHDATEELYLVSNVNGAPTAEDDNGFVSRLLPDGEVVALKWIDGAADSVTLNAPKGMALKGDTLLVADIDVVRLFHRATGRPLGAWPVPGSAFLNDVAVGPDGAVYVTDTGMLSTPDGMERTNADAVYRFDASGRPGIVAQGAALQGPNGVAVTADGVVIVSWNGRRLSRLAGEAEPSPIAELPGGQLDGVVALPDGGFLVTSWEGEAVYRIDPSGGVSTAVENTPSAADIGFDERRRRILVPLLGEDRLEIHPFPRSP